MNKKTINWYLERGFGLVRQNGKEPIDSWSGTVGSNKLDLLMHDGAMGALLPRTYLGIDIDGEIGTKSAERLSRDYGVDLSHPTVTTPNGFHFYFKLPDGIPHAMRKSLSGYDKVEFKTFGSILTIPGSKVSSKWYRSDVIPSKKTVPELPDLLYQALIKPSELTNALKHKLPSIDKEHTRESISVLLSEIDPSTSYNNWLKIGMAIHSWNQDAFELWDEWSKNSPKYVIGECEKKWRTFRTSREVTLGTLTHLSNEQRSQREEILLLDYCTRIEHATVNELSTIIATDIKKENFSKLNQERVVKNFMDSYYKKSGVKIEPYDVKKLLYPYEASKAPTWVENYVYVRKTDEYYEISNGFFHSPANLNHDNNKYVIPNKTGYRPNAVSFARESGKMKSVHYLGFEPTVNTLIYQKDGLDYLNTYKEPKYPSKVPDVLTDEEKAMGDYFVEHIHNFINRKEDSEYIVNWFAHQVQNPGVLLGWAPLIHSFQGIGKTIIIEVLKGILGNDNVFSVSPDEVYDKWTDYAYGRLVVCIEELQLRGKSKSAVSNRMKPFITNATVTINSKNKPIYNVDNRTNYIAFTNHKDALILEDSDRRWFITFVNHESVEDFLKHIGKTDFEYFEPLYKMKNYPHVMKRYFLDWEIPESFKKLIKAPMSKSKELLMQTHRFKISEITHHIPGLKEAQDNMKSLIESKWYVNEKALVSNLFFEHIFQLMDASEDRPTTRQKKEVLMQLGYIYNHGQVRFGDKRHSVYTKDKMTAQEIKEILKHQC